MLLFLPIFSSFSLGSWLLSCICCFFLLLSNTRNLSPATSIQWCKRPPADSSGCCHRWRLGVSERADPRRVPESNVDVERRTRLLKRRGTMGTFAWMLVTRAWPRGRFLQKKCKGKPSKSLENETTLWILWNVKPSKKTKKKKNWSQSCKLYWYVMRPRALATCDERKPQQVAQKTGLFEGFAMQRQGKSWGKKKHFEVNLKVDPY